MAASNPLGTRTIARIVLTVVVTLAVLYLLYEVRSVLLLIAIAAFLAVALGPPVYWFRRRGVPRALSILLVYLTIALGIFGIGLLVVPQVVSQVDQLAKDLPHYVDDLSKNAEFRKYNKKYHIADKLKEQALKLPSHLADAAGALQSITVGVFGALVKLVTVLTMTFFLLLDGEGIAAFLLRLRGPEHEERFRTISGDV